MKLDSLETLFLHELKDLYNAENQLLKALPKMVKAATNEALKAAFREHLEVTRNQVARLNTIFEHLEANTRGKKCAAMEGLIQEAKELLEEDAEPAVLDAALIASAQKIEHYEISGYGTLRTWASLLGYEEAETLLQDTLDEEKEADDALTELANTIINQEAEEADGAGVDDQPEEPEAVDSEEPAEPIRVMESATETEPAPRKGRGAATRAPAQKGRNRK